MEYWLVAIGLICFIEGFPYFAFPGKMKEWLYFIMNLPEHYLRFFGGFFMVLGLIFIYLGRRYGG